MQCKNYLQSLLGLVLSLTLTLTLTLTNAMLILVDQMDLSC